MILRGANDYMLDEMDRALHDALSIVKRTLESNTVNLVLVNYFVLMHDNKFLNQPLHKVIILFFIYENIC